jgi:hypothetical protein
VSLAGPWGAQCAIYHPACGLRVTVETYLAPKGPLQCKHCQRFGHTQRNCGYAARFVACVVSHLSGGCPAPW